jgi:quinoprotein glucose dehydrogenase
MTCMWNGEQYVVIAAGGHSESGTSIGDSVVAFRLARAGEAPSLWSRTIDRPGGRFYYSVAALITMTLSLSLFVVWTRLRRG